MRILLLGTALLSSVFLVGITGCDGCGSNARAAEAQANAQTQALLTEQARLAAQQRQADDEKQRLAREEQARYKAAIEQALQTVDGIFKTPGIQLTSAIKSLEDVDVSACPSDFRSAYVDFESSLENLQQITTTKADFDSDDNAKVVLGETIISAFANSNAAPLQDALQRDNQLKQQEQEARATVLRRIQALQRVSVIYGAS